MVVRKIVLSTLTAISCLFLVGCPQTTVKEARSTTGATIQISETISNSVLDADTNIVLFLSDLGTLGLEKYQINNGETVVNDISKNGKIVVRTQRVTTSWFGPSAWQKATNLDEFMVAATRSKISEFSRSAVVKHRHGDNFGHSVSNGDCVYGIWAFNLRGSSSYDNDEGAPDTTIHVGGCGILDSDPGIAFRKIGLLSDGEKGILAAKLQ